MSAQGASSSRVGVQNGDHELLEEYKEELEAIEAQIAKLQDTKRKLVAKRDKLASRIRSNDKSSNATSHGSGSARDEGPSATTNYLSAQFRWTQHLLPRAHKVWKIEKFRSVQEAVCNAALDGRDVVCVMPTGGGKSLCYQLPALLSKGLTLVVSPLISLSMDQMWHLREVGVPCEMLYSAATREEANDVLRRIKSNDTREEIKVLFVTPERVAKSKSLLAALQKSYEQDRLARIVIDEAHCCSQQGHDFRPDYKNLSILRKLFPEVPFLCLSATLAPTVLEDVRRILNLDRIVDPSAAPPSGTVYFTAPLHRPNLHYQVISRSSASKDANQTIADWILQNHPGQSGIVYTFSKADTHKMADALNELGRGKIRAAVYHADLEDQHKTSVHHKWRQGSIEVVVATIAFGMGIDKGDVRFVVHASLGTSLDSYYQETGRAGRDGEAADCVLFYRPADASRISSLLAGDPRGHDKLHSMLTYAQSARCRKAIFAEYFADRYGVSGSCGVCDNCQLPIEPSDVTVDAWKIVRIMEDVYEEGARITLSGLGDLCRGLGGGQYTMVDTEQRKRKKQKVKQKQSGFIKINEVVGEKVKLSKEVRRTLKEGRGCVLISTLQDTERVLVEMLLRGYLEDEYNATAYSVNVYVRPGAMSGRLSRLAMADVENKAAGCPTIFVKLLDLSGKRAARKTPSKRGKALPVGSSEDEDEDEGDSSLLAHKRASNGVTKASDTQGKKSSSMTLVGDDGVEFEYEDDEEDDYGGDHIRSTGNISMSSNKDDPIEIDSD